MDSKFGQITFIEKNGFWEFDSIEEMKEEVNGNGGTSIIGYFLPNTNYTYEELDKLPVNNDDTWVVTYHKVNESISATYQVVEVFNSLLQLRLGIDEIIDNSYRGMDEQEDPRNFTTVFNLKDIRRFK